MAQNNNKMLKPHMHLKKEMVFHAVESLLKILVKIYGHSTKKGEGEGERRGAEGQGEDVGEL